MCAVPKVTALASREKHFWTSEMDSLRNQVLFWDF